MTLRMHQTGAAGTDGRSCARRFFFALVLIAAFAATRNALADSKSELTVREVDGLYTVVAVFQAPAPIETVTEVLTDYEAIPRFMPDVRTSIVHERDDNRALVEQEATARFMMFSRRVHLRLEIREAGTTIGFRDECGESFSVYDGSWTLTARDGGTEIEYVLAARPTFDAPGFLLSRLMRRDAGRMIERLKTEIAARTRASPPAPSVVP